MFFKQLKRWTLVAILIAIPIFVFYIKQLDQQIRKKFEGKRWDIPAKVYANPLDLYVGYPLTVKEFKDLLEQLHYRVDNHLTAEGSYKIKGQQISLKTHSFTFWDGLQDSLTLKINFANNSVSKIVDLDLNRELAVVRMDPVQIGSFYPKLKEDRILITLKDAPVLLKQGLLATEDRDFYQHFGISMRGVARALLANVRAGGLVQGGSTITQQLVKNFYLTSERTLKRKINEVFMAILLDIHYSKEEILEAYFNEIYLGQDGASSIHGFGLASEFYFGQPLKSLDLAQIAGLITLVRGPSFYDLRRYPERAVERRNLVLAEMADMGYITNEEAKSAQQQPLQIVANAHRSVNRYPAFLDLVKRQLSSDYKEADLTTEGLRIFTTLDTQIQNTVEITVNKKILALEKTHKIVALETATIVTRKENGEIVALVGGKNALEPGFNRAIDALRPIGSLIKPAIYLTALSHPEQYTLNTPLEDVSFELDHHWTPKNFDGQEHGEVPLHKALSRSYNLATVKLGMDIGLKPVVKTLQNLGVNREVELLPSLLLGATPLTVWEVTQMYQTLADNGFFTPLKAIREVVSATNKPLQRYPFDTKQTVDPAAVYLTNSILQEVVREGTAKAAYKTLPKKWAFAGKTGTSNDLKDSWFAGFSGDYLSVVWVGRDDDQPMGLTGAMGALPVWTAVMKQIANQGVDLIVPSNIEPVWIDEDNGLLADEKCSTAKSFPYVIGSAPTDISSCGQTPPESKPDQDSDGNDTQNPKAEPSASDTVPETALPVTPRKSWFNKLY